MNIIQFELNKILQRRFSLILLVVTALVFPILIKVISQLSAVKDHVPEGLFASQVAFGIISYSQTFFFIPVWIIIFTGLEFSNGHVNRVVFQKSKPFYFKAKLVYCGLITLFFSVVGLASLVIAITTSPYRDLNVDILFYVQFVLQMACATFSFSLLLLALVLIIQSPIIGLIIYIGCSFMEMIGYTAVKGIYEIELFWLPFHLLRTLFAKNGESSVNDYYFPITESPTTLIAPILFVCVLLFITYYYFTKRSLKPLSD